MVTTLREFAYKQDPMLMWEIEKKLKAITDPEKRFSKFYELVKQKRMSRQMFRYLCHACTTNYWEEGTVADTVSRRKQEIG